MCGLKLWTWSPYHHQRVAVNGHICSQVVDIVVMDLVQNTAMCAVLKNQGLEVQSILMDHILCRRRFAVSAGIEVIRSPFRIPFQSIVQEIQCPVHPVQDVAQFHQLPCIIVPCFKCCDVPMWTQFFPDVIHDKLFGFIHGKVEVLDTCFLCPDWLVLDTWCSVRRC